MYIFWQYALSLKLKQKKRILLLYEFVIFYLQRSKDLNTPQFTCSRFANTTMTVVIVPNHRCRACSSSATARPPFAVAVGDTVRPAAIADAAGGQPRFIKRNRPNFH